MIPVKSHTCPNCHYQMDAVSAIDNTEDINPQEHDITLCYNCGQILEFQKDLSVLPVSKTTLDNLDEETKNTFLKVQQYILNKVKNN